MFFYRRRRNLKHPERLKLLCRRQAGLRKFCPVIIPTMILLELPRPILRKIHYRLPVRISQAAQLLPKRRLSLEKLQDPLLSLKSLQTNRFGRLIPNRRSRPKRRQRLSLPNPRDAAMKDDFLESV